MLGYDEEDPYRPAPPAAAPTTGGGGGGGGGAPAQGPGAPPVVETGGGGGGYTGPLRPTFGGANIPGAPRFVAPVWTAPDRAALTGSQDYLVRQQAGQDALERSAAAKGRLRTGGTLSNISEYNTDFNDAYYKSAYDRAYGDYGLKYQAAKDEYAPQFAQWQQRADLNKQAGLMGYQADLNDWTNQRMPRGGGSSGPSIEEILATLGPEPTAPVYGGGEYARGASAPPPVRYGGGNDEFDPYARNY